MSIKSIRTLAFLVLLAVWASSAPATARQVDFCSVADNDEDNAKCVYGENPSPSCQHSAAGTCNAVCDGDDWEWQSDPVHPFDGTCEQENFMTCGAYCATGTCFSRSNLVCTRIPEY